MIMQDCLQSFLWQCPVAARASCQRPQSEQSCGCVHRLCVANHEQCNACRVLAASASKSVITEAALSWQAQGCLQTTCKGAKPVTLNTCFQLVLTIAIELLTVTVLIVIRTMIAIVMIILILIMIHSQVVAIAINMRIAITRIQVVSKDMVTVIAIVIRIVTV